MIEFLKGKLIDKEKGHLILEAAGIGFGIDVSKTTESALPEIGGEVALFIHLHIAEKDVSLVGFASKIEKEIFEILIATSGIGPKMSLAILSAMPIEEFAGAILGKRSDILQEIPGVGKKTAERLILELKDKVQKFFKKANIEIEATEDGLSALSPKIRDSVAALVNLGIKQSAAYTAVKKAFKSLGENATIEDLIREGLKYR